MAQVFIVEGGDAFESSQRFFPFNHVDRLYIGQVVKEELLSVLVSLLEFQKSLEVGIFFVSCVEVVPGEQCVEQLLCLCLTNLGIAAFLEDLDLLL